MGKVGGFKMERGKRSRGRETHRLSERLRLLRLGYSMYPFSCSYSKWRRVGKGRVG